ncbi:hypothetical protein Hanom_Chr05g00444461 [Helianthus anomalus]
MLFLKVCINGYTTASRWSIKVSLFLIASTGFPSTIDVNSPRILQGWKTATITMSLKMKMMIICILS